MLFLVTRLKRIVVCDCTYISHFSFIVQAMNAKEAERKIAVLYSEPGEIHAEPINLKKKNGVLPLGGYLV